MVHGVEKAFGDAEMGVCIELQSIGMDKRKGFGLDVLNLIGMIGRR